MKRAALTDKQKIEKGIELNKAWRQFYKESGEYWKLSDKQVNRQTNDCSNNNKRLKVSDYW